MLDLLFPELFCSADPSLQMDVIDILFGEGAPAPSLMMVLDLYELAPAHVRRAALVALGVSL